MDFSSLLRIFSVCHGLHRAVVLSSVGTSYIANILAIIMGSVKFRPTGYC